MEEEIKNEVEVVDKPEEKPEQPQQNEEMTPQTKSALTAFAWLFSVAGIVLGCISLNKLKENDPETDKQPFKTFGRVAKPVAIVDIVVGAVMFVVYLVYFILAIVAAAKGIANS